LSSIIQAKPSRTYSSASKRRLVRQLRPIEKPQPRSVLVALDLEELIAPPPAAILGVAARRDVVVLGATIEEERQKERRHEAAIGREVDDQAGEVEDLRQSPPRRRAVYHAKREVAGDVRFGLRCDLEGDQPGRARTEAWKLEEEAHERSPDRPTARRRRSASIVELDLGDRPRARPAAVREDR
jgi:hypothetical protein